MTEQREKEIRRELMRTFSRIEKKGYSIVDKENKIERIIGALKREEMKEDNHI